MFYTEASIRNHYSSDYDDQDIITMTESTVRYILSVTPYNHTDGVKAKIPKNYFTVTNKIHTAHDIIRYKRINDVSRRLKPSPYTKHNWSAGNPWLVGEQTKIPFVIWLDEFFNPSTACTDINKLYIYLTPGGTWHAYSPDLNKNIPFQI